jgi:hypothetical protein
MNELQQELFEKQLRSLAKGLEYPRTPDVAGSVMARISRERLRSAPQGGDRVEGRRRFLSRRWAWSLTIILILCVSLMLIPTARAAIIDFIQIGVVRIFRSEPTPLPPPNQEVPSTIVPMTATPIPTAQLLIPILEKLAGEKTLEEAQNAVRYPILLPSYPPDLGKPDRVFVQDEDGAITVLVWLNPKHPDQILMSLHFLPEGSWAIKKMEPAQIQETTVNGQQAIWATGPYPLLLRSGDMQYMRLVEGHVLIWTDGNITYRLETDLSLEEALKIAQSLQPIKPK